MNKKNVVIISGATATGKSSFAIKFAQQINGEIINADIGSFYKPMSIGVAKPKWQNESVPHHMFDIIDEPVLYSIAKFRKDLVSLLQDIWSRGKVPIITGGSVFYIQSFFYQQHEVVGTDVHIQNLESSSLDSKDLWNQLHKIDNQRAKVIDPQDRYRVIRALAIFHATGKKPSEFKPIFNPLSDYYFIICDRDRDELYQRIDRRVIEMIDEGWLDEVKKLQGSSWEQFLLRKKMIGYDDLLLMLQDKKSLSKTIAIIQKKTRNYAKRQITFLKKMHNDLLIKGSDNLVTLITPDDNSLQHTVQQYLLKK
ncbi:MAG: tRNA (adenosine(37)-N6)-dimethylallyltransferase MiaA [Epsilonproteobacteria bacterium]|nr:tRNA (adenosine(37)-N6)-dimethylallyltransferase MiaA [Campylobacterota bacterium]|tara:strand:+ start:136 stop:1065 length:930 start_codon:yes stop_codon:yes gene_type:complete